jgi:hypothetical protein
VELRFRDKEVTLGVQKGPDLSNESRGVWDFVDHPEGEDEINRACYAKIVGSTVVSLDARPHTSSGGTFPENIQHLLLEIDSNNSAMAPYETGHADGKEPHATANVEYRHPWTNICLEYLPWVMEEPPQEIVEQVGVSPRTDMVFQDKAPRSQGVICQTFFKRLRDSAKRLEEPAPSPGPNKGRIIRL